MCPAGSIEYMAELLPVVNVSVLQTKMAERAKRSAIVKATLRQSESETEGKQKKATKRGHEWKEQPLLMGSSKQAFSYLNPTDSQQTPRRCLTDTVHISIRMMQVI
jgi:hypothetical protein